MPFLDEHMEIIRPSLFTKKYTNTFERDDLYEDLAEGVEERRPKLKPFENDETLVLEMMWPFFISIPVMTGFMEITMERGMEAYKQSELFQEHLKFVKSSDMVMQYNQFLNAFLKNDIRYCVNTVKMIINKMDTTIKKNKIPFDKKYMNEMDEEYVEQQFNKDMEMVISPNELVKAIPDAENKSYELENDVIQAILLLGLIYAEPSFRKMFIGKSLTVQIIEMLYALADNTRKHPQSHEAVLRSLFYIILYMKLKTYQLTHTLGIYSEYGFWQTMKQYKDETTTSCYLYASQLNRQYIFATKKYLNFMNLAIQLKPTSDLNQYGWLHVLLHIFENNKLEILLFDHKLVAKAQLEYLTDNNLDQTSYLELAALNCFLQYLQGIGKPYPFEKYGGVFDIKNEKGCFLYFSMVLATVIYQNVFSKPQTTEILQQTVIYLESHYVDFSNVHPIMQTTIFSLLHSISNELKINPEPYKGKVMNLFAKFLVMDVLSVYIEKGLPTTPKYYDLFRPFEQRNPSVDTVYQKSLIQFIIRIVGKYLETWLSNFTEENRFFLLLLGTLANPSTVLKIMEGLSALNSPEATETKLELIFFLILKKPIKELAPHLDIAFDAIGTHQSSMAMAIIRNAYFNHLFNQSTIPKLLQSLRRVPFTQYDLITTCHILYPIVLHSRTEAHNDYILQFVQQIAFSPAQYRTVPVYALQLICRLEYIDKQKPLFDQLYVKLLEQVLIQHKQPITFLHHPALLPIFDLTHVDQQQTALNIVEQGLKQFLETFKNPATLSSSARHDLELHLKTLNAHNDLCSDEMIDLKTYVYTFYFSDFKN